MIGRIFLGRYEVQELLGEGGMGRVYLARQTDMGGRHVVVKVMHEHIAEDGRFRERFHRETLLMKRFRHPYAVEFIEANLDGPFGPCLVMEYVKGVNLEALLLKNKRFSAPRVAKLIGNLCEVLQAAHDEGFIHRDLKPANLMIIDPDTPQERVKVMDFGLAKLIDDDNPQRKVTDTNLDFAVGTPAYIAPEQVRGEPLDHRSDIYSVGVMIYELLTGRLPFQGLNGMDVLLAHATDTPPRFAELGLAGWVPDGVEDLVFDCLAKEVDDRPQSARELSELFDTAIDRAQTRADEKMWATPRPMQFMTPPAGYPALPGSDELIDLVPAQGSDAVSAPTRQIGTETTERHPALEYRIDAWMPETIALMKLRGFVHDSGGEVVDNAPGIVKVRLGKSRHSTSFSWFGLARRAGGPIDLELRLGTADKKNPNRLTIHVSFKPSHPGLAELPEWRDRCADIYVQLRAYLMGGRG